MPIPSHDLMLPHVGLVTAFMALLALAGLYKLVDHSPTSGALRAAGLPSSPIVVRLLGGLELVVGITGIVDGGPIPALAGALLYAGFLVFVLEALRRRLPISSCGCLGATDTPPTVAHVIVNLAAVATLVLGALFPIGMLGGLHEAELSTAVAFLLFTGTVVYLLHAVITVLPLRRGARRAASVQLTGRGPRVT